MYHQSTIYIRKDLLSRLVGATDTLNMKRSRIIEILLVKYMEKNKGGERNWEMQKYQRIKKGERCTRICVFWRKDFYERNFDFRKSFKKSVSLIIAEAIEKYLDDIIAGTLSDKEAYNYTPIYSIFMEYYSNAYVCASIWGDPGPEIFHKMLQICP